MIEEKKKFLLDIAKAILKILDGSLEEQILE
jgi:hypothetical protein